MSLRNFLPGSPRSWAMTLVSLSVLGGATVPASHAIEPPQKKALLRDGIRNTVLDVEPTLRSIGGGRLADRAAAPDIPEASANGLRRLMEATSPGWEVRWDDRSDRAHLVQGVGVALLPGAGNRLRAVESGLVDAAGADRAASVDDMERLLRGFMADYADVLRVDPASLRLDRSRSAIVGNGRAWFVEFQQEHRGVPVDGANVYFRVNHGNIVQFGTDRVTDVRVSTRPTIAATAAFGKLLQRIGIARASVREVVDAGTLKLYPALTDGERPAQAFAGERGRGYTHRLGWEYVFRVKGDEGTYKAAVNARTGEVLSLVDLTVNADVTGGVYPVTNTDPQVVVPFPYTNVTNGTAKITDANGSYTYSGGTATAALDGRYIKIVDNCGAISLSDASTGNLAFGTSGGTDCTTPGTGGLGNTHSARSGYYHLTNINRKAAGFLSGNSWLNGTLTSNMNINNTCNAFWNGTSVNFYRSGGGCSNTGELAAVFLHEWGHGMDTNSGGAASENASGEAVGDTFAFLETKDSCIGHNFKPGVPCYNCTDCTGVRDVAVFAQGGPRTIARPSTVADDNGINCDRYACPYTTGVFRTPYQGPMGYQGHCESHIASTANWDLAQSMVAAHGPTAGWAAMDALWYESLVPSKSAYRVASGGTCNPAAVVDGCSSSNWYTVYLSVDDDNGNLADGTPNGCRIWDAFNAHGIACGARPACSGGGGCTTTPVADAGPDRSIASGGSATIGTAALVGHAYSWSPGGQTTAQISVTPSSTTTYTVTATTDCGSASDSVVVNVAAASDTTAPTAPSSLTASAGKRKISLSWGASSDNVGVTAYLVSRATSSAGPFTQIATTTATSYSNTNLASGTTYYYQVKAQDAAGNVSAASNTASATVR